MSKEKRGEWPGRGDDGMSKKETYIGSGGVSIVYEIGAGVDPEPFWRSTVRFLARCLIVVSVGYCVAGMVLSLMGWTG